MRTETRQHKHSLGAWVKHRGAHMHTVCVYTDVHEAFDTIRRQFPLALLSNGEGHLAQLRSGA